MESTQQLRSHFLSRPDDLQKVNRLVHALAINWWTCHEEFADEAMEPLEPWNIMEPNQNPQITGYEQVRKPTTWDGFPTFPNHNL